MDWMNNEDAGDLAIMGRADFEGEMAAQADDERRYQFLTEFDSIGAGYHRMVESRIGLVCDSTLCPGPSEAPHCEECGRRLSRADASAAVYCGREGVFFCSEDCQESHLSGPYFSEGREFPTYG